MMQGFGVHSFAFINAEGKRTFVKFHWRPLLGLHGLAWDEAQKLGGVDPDFHRRDLYEAIASGNFPEYEFGIQCVAEEDEHKFDFDILDSTKIIPEASSKTQSTAEERRALMPLVLTCSSTVPSHLHAVAVLCAQELVPIQYVGKIVLNRLPTDFFAEVEQVAFWYGTSHTG
jgi:catalase